MKSRSLEYLRASLKVDKLKVKVVVNCYCECIEADSEMLKQYPEQFEHWVSSIKRKAKFINFLLKKYSLNREIDIDKELSEFNQIQE